MTNKILIFLFLVAVRASTLYCQPRPFGLGSEVNGTSLVPVINSIAPIERDQIRPVGPGTEVNISTRAQTGGGHAPKGGKQPPAAAKIKKQLKTYKIKEEAVRLAPKTKEEKVA